MIGMIQMVHTTIHKIAKIPTNWVEVSPKNAQVVVLSDPKIKEDIGIQILEEVETIQINQLANQMKVPIKAKRSLTENSNQEKIPPSAFGIAEPYSAIINAAGRKKKIAAIIYQKMEA